MVQWVIKWFMVSHSPYQSKVHQSKKQNLYKKWLVIISEKIFNKVKVNSEIPLMSKTQQWFKSHMIKIINYLPTELLKSQKWPHSHLWNPPLISHMDTTVMNKLMVMKLVQKRNKCSKLLSKVWRSKKEQSPIFLSHTRHRNIQKIQPILEKTCLMNLSSQNKKPSKSNYHVIISQEDD